MESLLVVVRVPREDASTAPHQNTRLTSSRDTEVARSVTANTAESPGQTSQDDASDDQTDPAMAASTSDTAADAMAKKRKSTYSVRKEEVSELREEVVTLRDELRTLKAQQLQFQPLSRAEVDVNTSLRWQVAQNRIAIAGAQSLIASYNAQYGSPLLGSYIHLPRDPMQRQAILEGLKPQKMEEALAFMGARCQFLDLRRHYRQVESYEAPNGDRISNHWEIAKIKEGHPSVRRVYEEMLAFARTSEMTIAEKVGLVSVRESDTCNETVDATQIRELTTYSPHHLVEKNLVAYTQYFARSEVLDQPHGLMLFDYVDQDDAHPYQPHERIRTDICSASMVVQCSDEPPAVAIVRWGYKRIHHTLLATDEEIEGIARDGLRSYFDVMIRTIRERLSWHQ